LGLQLRDLRVSRVDHTRKSKGGMVIYSLINLRTCSARELELPAVFNCVNTRLIIQTGINLKRITAEQNRDRATLDRVSGALRRMGVALESK
jgi:hypothetical protein